MTPLSQRRLRKLFDRAELYVDRLGASKGRRILTLSIVLIDGEVSRESSIALPPDFPLDAGTEAAAHLAST